MDLLATTHAPCVWDQGLLDDDVPTVVYDPRNQPTRSSFKLENCGVVKPREAESIRRVMLCRRIPECPLIPIDMNRLTRDDFVASTCKLLSKSGGTDFAITDVLDLCGAQKGSLYHFFPDGKKQLIVAAVEHLADIGYAYIQSIVESQPSVADAAFHHLSGIAKCVDTHQMALVPMSVIAGIKCEDAEEVRDACQKALERFELPFFEGLKSQGMDTRRARGLAGFIITTGEGALVRARTCGSSKLVRESAKQLRAAIVSATD